MLAVFARVGLLVFSPAARINAPLRARRSAFRKLLVLSPHPISEVAAGAKRICRDSRAGTRSLPVLAARIRGNARPRASTDQRTEERHAFHRGTGVETAQFAFVAGQATAKERRAIHGRAVDAQAVLANAILRFQRLESREGAREARLHARQSVEEQTGGPPTRLAVEQFLVLRDRRAGTAETDVRR